MTDVVLDPLRWESLEAGDTAAVVAWLVAEGDHVHAGQALARVSPVGETLEVGVPHAGAIADILVAAGERSGPGHVLARLVMC